VTTKANLSRKKSIRMTVYITEEEQKKLMSIAVFNKTPPRDCLSLLINKVYEREKINWLLSKMEKKFNSPLDDIADQR